MALTYFYAELLGVIFGVIGLAMLVNRPMMREALREMVENRGVLLVTALVTLVLGLLVVLTHNVWNGGLLVVLVTLFGWAMTVKGALLMLFPHATLRRIYDSGIVSKAWTICAVVALVLGIYLAWSGFAGY